MSLVSDWWDYRWTKMKRVREAPKEHYQAFEPEKNSCNFLFFLKFNWRTFVPEVSRFCSCKCFWDRRTNIIKTQVRQDRQKETLSKEWHTRYQKDKAKEGENLMSSDSDVEISDKKNSNLEAPKVKPSLSEIKESKILSPHLSQKHKKTPRVRYKVK